MDDLPPFPAQTPLALHHQPLIADLLGRKGIHSSDYSFYNLWGWYYENPPMISGIGQHLVLSIEGPAGSRLFLAPLGEGSILEPLAILLGHLDGLGPLPAWPQNTSVGSANPGLLPGSGSPRSLHYVPARLKEEIEKAVPGCRAEAQRAQFDYLYDRRELAELAGRKFHQKKNFVNRVLEDLHPQVEIFHKSQLGEVEAYFEHWYAQFPSADENVKVEAMAVRRSLPLLDSMGGLGLLVRVNGQLAGVTIATPVHPGCWVVTVEKAERSLKGMYQFLNWALVNRLPPEVDLVNRETDLGIEGLQTSKLSYHPTGFEEKFSIWF